MTVGVTHSTPADGTFSGTGATAWNAGHTVTGLGALAELNTVGTTQIDDAAVTLAKMADLAQDQFIGRTSASTGVPQTATITAAGRALIDDADNTAQRSTLGLGSIATQAANNVTITGGSITGITDIAVADGGTGASTASGARTAFDLDAAFNVGLGWIQGLQISYSSTTAIAIAAGSIRVNGTIVTYGGATLTSGSTMKDISNSTVTLGASAAYWVFISSGGVIGIEINDGTGDGATPTFDTTLDYWKAASTGAAWRRIGKFWSNGSSQIIKFQQTGAGRTRRYYPTHIAVQVVTNGTATTFGSGSVTITPYATGDDEEMRLFAIADISSGTSVFSLCSLSTDGGTDTIYSISGVVPTSGSGARSGPNITPYTGTLNYLVSGTNARANVYLAGFGHYV